MTTVTINECLYKINIDFISKGSVSVLVDKGDKGDKGDTGPANTLSIGTVQKGNDAAATITGTAPNQTLNLTLPKGDKGDTGEKGDKGDTGSTGPANSLSIGTVESGSTAVATITGTAPEQTLNLTLPKGDKGDTGSKGDTGNDGFSPTVTTSKSGKVTTITITDANGPHTATINDGADGQGSGDMLKSTYDTNASGVVDNAEKVNNHTVAADVPANAAFTDTTYSAGTNVQISSGNVISATDTTYTAGTNVQISNSNVISATDTTYTAGTNVSINNGVISATDTTYTAGTNISITNGSISASVPTVVQATGTSTTDVMSQDAVTDALDDLALDIPTITLSTTDIGEGVSLAANTLYGVYQ